MSWAAVIGQQLGVACCGTSLAVLMGPEGFNTPPPAVVYSVVFSVVLGECLWCLWGFLLADFSWVTLGDLRLPWSPIKLWKMDPLIFEFFLEIWNI